MLFECVHVLFNNTSPDTQATALVVTTGRVIVTGLLALIVSPEVKDEMPEPLHEPPEKVNCPLDTTLPAPVILLFPDCVQAVNSSRFWLASAK